MSIEPTVGRIVHYWEALPGGFNRPDMLDEHMKTVQPQAGIVVYVHPDAPMINITRFSRDGVAIPQMDVPLVQDDMPVPTHGGWAVWMPYQKGQAAKTEAMEARLAQSESREGALEGRVGMDEARLRAATPMTESVHEMSRGEGQQIGSGGPGETKPVATT